MTFLRKIEFDFNLIITNAVIYNNHNHPINREARKLFHAAKSVFSKWSKKAGGYSCKSCSGESKADDPLLICDFCCQSVHQICFLKPGTKALVLWSQEILHPLRGDLAFFCSDDCQKQFRSTCGKFRFPSTSVLSSSTETMFPPSKGVPGIDGLENSLENLRATPNGNQIRGNGPSDEATASKSVNGKSANNPDQSENSKVKGTMLNQQEVRDKLANNRNTTGVLSAKAIPVNNPIAIANYGIKATNIAKQNLSIGLMPQVGNVMKLNNQSSPKPNEPYLSAKLPGNKDLEKAQQAKYHASIRNLQVSLCDFDLIHVLRAGWQDAFRKEKDIPLYLFDEV